MFSESETFSVLLIPFHLCPIDSASSVWFGPVFVSPFLMSQPGLDLHCFSPTLLQKCVAGFRALSLLFAFRLPESSFSPTHMIDYCWSS